jgi:hypothetical protein
LANDPDFAGTTHLTKVTMGDTSLYTFQKLDASGYYDLGTVAQLGSNTPIKLASYVPPIQTYKFPLTYQTSWQSSSTVTGPAGIPGAVITNVNESTIDGYGNLMIPGTTVQSLRMVQKSTRTTTYQNIEISKVTTYLYSWITAGPTSASINADQAQTPQSVSYATAPTGSVNADAETSTYVQLSANPATTSTTIRLMLPKSGPSKVLLSDILGTTCSILFDGPATAGMISLPLEVNQLSNGTYFLRVESPGLTATRKVIIAH